MVCLNTVNTVKRKEVFKMSDKNQSKKPKSDKPLVMRIVMLAIAAAMILGLVVGSVASAMTGV
jgi:hypothetical protein